MAQVNLGRIGFVNKGSWNSATSYKLNDVVKYGGSTYAAKRPNVGITPPINGTDTADWFYFINNSDYVDKTSDQDIAGIKNFTNGITTTEITTTEINGDKIIDGKTTFVTSPIVPTPTANTQAANKEYVDSKTLNINTLTDKPTPDNTDNFALQEVGGGLKKVSYKDLIKLPPNDTNVKTALNASGGAPIYACRAWVNFNGTGTVAIRASGNVSSITDNGVGDYTVNFTTAMPDANYTCSGMSAYKNDTTDNVDGMVAPYRPDTYTPSINEFRVRTGSISSSSSDSRRTQLSFHR